MKKQRRSSRTTRKGATLAGPTRGTQTAVAGVSRRDMLRRIRNGAVAAGVLSLGGWGVAHSYQSHVERHDLSVIGNGIPTVVQIHDPQCATCRALQKQATRAAQGFDADALQLRVANIRSDEGRALADRHGVPHVTLLLFDAQGELRHVLRGLRESDDLAREFRAHVAHAAGS